MRRWTWLLILSLCLACHGAGPNAPLTSAIVAFVYVSHFTTCPKEGTLDYGVCLHHSAPAGTVNLRTFWNKASIRMKEAGPARWQLTLADVPVGVPLLISIFDIKCCCFDQCAPLQTSDVYANGVLLTHLVDEPHGQYGDEFLEFQIAADGSLVPY